MRVKIVLGVGLAIASIQGSAHGADLPARGFPPAPEAPAPVPFNWTGAYFGLDGGYNWGDANGAYRISSATLAALPPIIPTIDAAGSHSLGLRGGLFGAELGYNWQGASPLVFGVEGDFDWSGLSGSLYNSGIVPVAGGPYSISQRFKTDWFATLRGRVGFAPVDRLLLFATAGAAAADFNYSSAFTDSFNENENVSINTVKIGWTAGLGAEYALTPNWSTKIEYLYSQFPAGKAVGSALLTDGTTAYAAHSTGVLDVNMVRVGLNYRLD